MSLSALQDALQHVAQGKSAEKKKGAKDLYSLLENKSVLKILDKNSLMTTKDNDNITTWTTVFKAVDIYFDWETASIKESEYGTKKDSSYNSSQLVQSVITSANRTVSRPFIRLNILHQFLVKRLKNSKTLSIFGHKFLRLLQNFLTAPLYTSLMDGDNWIDIIKTLLFMMERQNPAPKAEILETFVAVIELSSDSPSVIPLLRTKVLEFFKASFSSKRELDEHALTYIKGFTHLCKFNAVEFRQSLCAVGEEILPDLISFVEAHADDGARGFALAEAAHELFVIQMKLHMPQDTSFSSRGFYARGLDVWATIVRKLYIFSLDSIETIANKKGKKRLGNLANDDKIPDHLLELAIRCTKQISLLPASSQNTDRANGDDSDGEAAGFTQSFSKRRKMWTTFHETIREVCQKKNLLEQSIWLSYITAVLHKYPELIESDSEFTILMETAMNLLTSNITSANANQVFSLFQCLLKFEQCFNLKNSERDEGVVKQESSLWNNVWGLVIRFLSSNDSDSALELLLAIFIHWKPTNVDSVLSLYLKKSFPLNKISLTLLSEILSHCSLPQNSNSSVSQQYSSSCSPFSSSPLLNLRFSLLEWLLPASRQQQEQKQQQQQKQLDSDSENLIISLQIGLLLGKADVVLAARRKGHMDNKHISVLKSFGDQDFENILMISSFEASFPLMSFKTTNNNNNTSSETSEQALDSLTSILQSLTADDISSTVSTYLEFLQKNHSEKFRSIDFDVENDASLTRLATELRFHIKSYIETLNLLASSNCTFEFQTKLENLMCSSLTLFLNKFNQYLVMKIQFMNESEYSCDDNSLLSRVLSSLDSILEGQTTWCDTIKTKVMSIFPPNLIENIFTMLERAQNVSSGVDENNDEPDVDRKREENSVIVIKVLKLLSEYGSLKPDERLPFFQKTIQYCTNQHFSIFNQMTFDISAALVSYLIPLILQTPELVGLILDLIQKMCKAHYMSKTCSLTIWMIFTELIPAISGLPHRPLRLDAKRRLMVLIGSMSGFIPSHGIKVCHAAVSALEQLAQHDYHLTWSWFEPKAAKGKSPVKTWPLLKAYTWLKIPSQQVVLSVLRVVFTVFTCHHYRFLRSSIEETTAGPTTIDGNERIADCFQHIYDALLNSFVQLESATYSSEERTELKGLCTSVSLLCLSHVIFISPYLQEKALFRVMQLAKSKDVDMNLAHQALQKAHPRAFKIIKLKTPSIIENWLETGLKIQDFPYQLLGFKDNISLTKEYKEVVAVKLFELGQTRDLEQLASQCETTSLNLIKKYFPKLLARRLTSLCQPSNPNGYSSSMDCNPYDSSSRNNSMIVMAVGGSVAFQQLLRSNIGDIILEQCNLLRFAKDIAGKWNFNEMGISRENQYPHSHLITEDCFFKSLPLLSRSLGNITDPSSSLSPSAFDHLARNSAKSVYLILLDLAKQVHETCEATLLHQRLVKLYHFSFFSNFLMNSDFATFEFTRGYGAPFVIQAYLRFLSSENQDLSQDETEPFLRAVILAFHEFLTKLLNEASYEIQPYYNEIVYKLVEKATVFPRLIDHIKRPLNHLLIDHRGKFDAHIKSLDLFPKTVPHFLQYNTIQEESSRRTVGESLSDKLTVCLKEMKKSKHICTSERLQNVMQLLVDRKEEFRKLVKNLEERGVRFYNECTNDVVHNLVGVLLGIIQDSEKKLMTSRSNGMAKNVIIEAARCLGWIGPVNLSTLVLPPHENYDFQCQNKISDTVRAITKIESPLINRILQYVYEDDDVNTAETAGKVLSNVLVLQEFLNTLSDDPQYSPISRNNTLLKPFIQSSKTVPQKEIINDEILTVKLQECYVNDQNFNNYNNWLTKLTFTLISCFTPGEGSLIHKLGPLCTIKGEFCEEVLPFVIKSLLLTGKSSPTVRAYLTEYFQNFFSRLGESETSPAADGQGDFVYTNKLAIRCLLKVVQYLRLYDVPKEFLDDQNATPTPWDNNFWLKLDYMSLAKAAQHCGAFLSSVLYLEVFAAEKELGSRNTDSQPMCELSVNKVEAGEPSTQMNYNESFEVFKRLLTAYTSIGEEDTPYGCGSARFSDFQSNIQHLEQLQSWNQILYAYDTQGIQNEGGICNSMKNLGLYNSLWTHLEGIKARTGFMDKDVEEVWYECGWRLSKWDLNSDKVTYLNDNLEDSIKGVQPENFQRLIYESVQAGLRGETDRFHHSIQKGFQVVIQDLKHASLESSENIYNFLSKFQIVQTVEDILNSDEGQITKFVSTLLENRKQCIFSDFKYQEPVLYMTKTLLRACETKYPKLNLKEQCHELLFDLIIKAREAGRLELAEKYASEITCSVTEPSFVKKHIEMAKNHWTRGNTDIAKHILNKLINSKTFQSSALYPDLLLQYGQWQYETVAESPVSIFLNYLSKALKFYQQAERQNSEDISKSYIVLAKYADAQYQILVDHMQSDLFRNKQTLLNKCKEEQQVKNQGTSEDERMAMNKSLLFLRKQANLDSIEIQSTIKEKNEFQELALKYYLLGLQTSNEYDLLVFRCIALWLDNSSSRDSEQCNKLNFQITKIEIPVHKYIDVLHQITARLGNKGATGVTHDVVVKILVKCGESHPHHTLPIIMAQAMLYKDKEVLSNNKALKTSAYSGQERVIEAGRILEKLRAKKSIGQLVSKLDKLWLTFITLANTPVNSLGSLKGLDEIPVPTIILPVSPSGKYEKFIGIKSFGKNFEMVGGINAPKKIFCIGTNGVKYNMLLKGNDDLRQDAVMQQVFCAMNQMLANEPKTKKRRLLMRVYKVVPLSQRSGVIEWCENTQTIGDYLVRAHTVYRPQDYKPPDCRKMMNSVTKNDDVNIKYNTYVKIMQNFQPVFRHFFFEQFKDPGSFFERRLAYTRSVATSSMIGFILGIGDRHVMNLLLDKITAEVIHIDLGVAFDQGKLLPTPETIPFRLTRDIVDGMGVCGVDGVFRRSCEMTLQVLRKNSDIILTILEVLLYDPLYLWTLTDDRKQKIQPLEDRTQRKSSSVFNTLELEAPQQQNNSAARELRRLRCKLAGIQEGGSVVQPGGSSSGTSMSVEGQVSFLIQTAIEPVLLCKLFPGWQPYL